VAGPGRLVGRAVEYGVLECLGGTLADVAGGGGVAVTRRVGAEVALPRSHLVEAARGELAQANKGAGLEQPAVWVSGRIWRSLVPFFHQGAPAQVI